MKATLWVLSLAMGILAGSWLGTLQGQTPATAPTTVYVPYDSLKGIMASQKGVFMPYAEFERLWKAALQAPAAVDGAPAPYLISTARYSGKVGAELATLDLELTIDVLNDSWVEVPLGLTDVAVSAASFVESDPKAAAVAPLLRVVDGKYILLAKGKGRKTLKLQFVRQLVTQPGLNVLSFGIPKAAVTTLELMIPEENMKVDVKPMVAATTEQVDEQGVKGTRLKAFMGSSETIQLSWKPKAQTASDLAPVVIVDQFQHLDIGEALITYDVTFKFDIRRRGVDTFNLQLPAGFRITAIDGDNISKWDIQSAEGSDKPQSVVVKLFTPAKDSYTLTAKMERFLQDAKVELALTPVLVQQSLRQTGLIALSHSARRSVEVRSPLNIARVDTGRLGEELQKRPGVTAWRFVSPDYSATLAIDTVMPKINVQHNWALGVEMDRLQLAGQLNFQVERAGVFELTMDFPEPWEIVSVGPQEMVDSHRLSGKGASRKLTVLLKKEMQSSFALTVSARQPRGAGDEDVNFTLPLPEEKGIENFSGQVMLYLPEGLRAEVGQLNQLSPLSVGSANNWTSFAGLSPAMAFQFRSLDRTKTPPPGGSFKIAIKPSQVSAVVYRLVSIEPGWVDDEAIVQYRIQYAPVDTFYLKIPAQLIEAGAQITGDSIKERRPLDKMPAELIANSSQAVRQASTPATTAATAPGVGEALDKEKWRYYQITLQSPLTGSYQLKVSVRRPFKPGEPGQAAQAVVLPILAAGKLSDQTGYVAIAKAQTLALGEPQMENLIAGDAGSATDLPYEPHRRVATLAFRYTAPPFALSLPVAAQKEAAVFTTIASAAVIEQVLAGDGTMNTNATYLLSTSRGDRLVLTLPTGAKLFGVKLNGAESPVEMGTATDQRIVRLPPTAGQVSKLMLEISYGQDPSAKAFAGGVLSAPLLPADVPVQQTLWRLWMPQEDYLLGHDRNFSEIRDYEAQQMLSNLSQEYGMSVAFKLSPQGDSHDFLRQGAPGKLSLTTMGKKSFGILTWVLVLAAGVAMLRLSGYKRALIVLAGAVLASGLYLFWPLMIPRMARVAVGAMLLVLGLWLAQWLFVRIPQWSKRRKPQAPPAPPAAPAALGGGDGKGA